jgi:hypothetical protein
VVPVTREHGSDLGTSGKGEAVAMGLRKIGVATDWPMRGALSIGVLGDLRVSLDHVQVPAGPTRHQICLALLACRPNPVVPTSALIAASGTTTRLAPRRRTSRCT